MASGSSSAVQEVERGQRELDRRLFEVIFNSLPSFFFLHQFPNSAQRRKGEKKESRENGNEAEGASWCCIRSAKGQNSVEISSRMCLLLSFQAASQHLPHSRSVLQAGMNARMRAAFIYLLSSVL